MDQHHFQQTEVSFILNSSFQQFQFANINLSGDKPYHINAHYIKLAHFLKFFHGQLYRFSWLQQGWYLVCLHDVFSNAHGYNIQDTVVQYIFVMGTTHTEPYQRPQKG